MQLRSKSSKCNNYVTCANYKFLGVTFKLNSLQGVEMEDVIQTDRAAKSDEPQAVLSECAWGPGSRAGPFVTPHGRRGVWNHSIHVYNSHKVNCIHLLTPQSTLLFYSCIAITLTSPPFSGTSSPHSGSSPMAWAHY